MFRNTLGILLLPLIGVADGSGNGVKLASWRWEEYSNTLTFNAMLILVVIFKILFHRFHVLSKRLPESCVLIILGVVAGFVINFGLENNTHHFPSFTSSLFFNVLLPPVILDSAYSLYDRDFLSNLGPVLLYAVAGTLFNIFAIGGCLRLLWLTGLMDEELTELPLLQCLIFSSLISAVDPVAVLSIFEEIGVNMGLYFLVFGESLLNDGVTVVLYNTVMNLSNQETIETSQYILAVFSFFTVAVGGLLVGVIIGMISAFILKYTTDSRVVEPLLLVILAYFAFALAETLHWSGIISIIGCGIAQKRYAFQNISKKSYTTIKYGIKTLSSASDATIFLFLGTITVKTVYDFQWFFIFWTVLLCLVVRFVGVFFLSWIININQAKPIKLKEQFILAYGGLRGAVGFSLAVIIPDSNPLKNLFITATIIMILFTVFLQGSTIKFLVNALKITKKGEKDKSLSGMINSKTLEHVMFGIEAVSGRVWRYTLLENIRFFDEHYIKSILIKKGTANAIARKLDSVDMSEHYARLYGPTIIVADKNSRVKSVYFDEEDEDTNVNILGKKDRLNEKTLKLAFKDNPYEQYKRRHMSSSREDMIGQIDRSKKAASMIGRRISMNLHNQKLQKSWSLNEEERKRINARNKWVDAGSIGATAALIKRQYDEAKTKFKNYEDVSLISNREDEV